MQNETEDAPGDKSGNTTIVSYSMWSSQELPTPNLVMMMFRCFSLVLTALTEVEHFQFFEKPEEKTPEKYTLKLTVN